MNKNIGKFWGVDLLSEYVANESAVDIWIYRYFVGQLRLIGALGSYTYCLQLGNIFSVFELLSVEFLFILSEEIRSQVLSSHLFHNDILEISLENWVLLVILRTVTFVFYWWTCVVIVSLGVLVYPGWVYRQNCHQRSCKVNLE